MSDTLPQGLTEQEASSRLLRDGPNELPSSKARGWISLIREVAEEPMILLLVAASAIYFILGDFKEALMLGASVVLVIAITLYQERKTERAIEALRDLTSPRALVVRDGQARRIPGREVVAGDLILLSEGDRIPADGTLETAAHVATDESLLTGESLSVRKLQNDKIFSGTLVVQGHGAARVTAIGAQSEMGRIGKMLVDVQPEKTRLQQETGRLVKVLALIAVALCITVAVLFAWTRHDALGGLLAGITLAMSMIPEEIPVVLTVFLALGAWRMSARHVLTRRIAAIETLGAATVLCVDKTGTLTQNKMAIERLFAGEETYDLIQKANDELPETFHELGEFSLLASQKNPFDPMEKAILEVANRYLEGTEHVHRDWQLVREYPLTPQLLALSHVWKSPEGKDYVIAAKGAPEAIFDLCHLPPDIQDRIAQQVKTMAGEGFRVLAVAKAYFHQEELPEIQHDFVFKLVGLLGFNDPIRPTVPEALRVCRSAGLKVVMITGDYPGTALHVSKTIELTDNDEVLTGQELAALSMDELAERARRVRIYARMTPELKLKLVEALKRDGETVAMTGDGVNDAPALKSAHIGVAMGGRGTDVAREAASLVLTDDDFSSIVAAVRMGRRIFDNLRKAIIYIIAIHVPIAGLALVPVLFGWPLIFFPAHIVFLELIIDPVCSVVFEAEAEESDVMQHPPRNALTPLASKRVIVLGLLQGLGVLAASLSVGVWAHSTAHSAGAIRALTFLTLIAGNLSLILANRSLTLTLWHSLRTPNRALWAVMGAAVIILLAIFNIPMLRELFLFESITVMETLGCLGAGLAGLAWFELVKWIVLTEPYNRRRSLARSR